MDPKQIAEMLSKAVDSALNANKKESIDKDSKLVEVIGDVAKAVSAINTRMDNLEKVAVKNVPETPETMIEKLSKTIENLSNEIKEMKNPVSEDDKPVELGKMTKKEFAAFITGLNATTTESSPKGKGKDDLASTIGKIAKGEDAEVEVDVEDIESEDVAGNPLSKKQKSSRKELDDWFGKKIGDSVAKKMGVSSEDDSDEDDDDDSDDE